MESCDDISISDSSSSGNTNTSVLVQVVVFSDSIDELNWKPVIKRQQIYINEKKKDDFY
jgi:hypothetical protein